ncbi:MAG: hypothetical protein GC160_07805 [Acidobacteria bacterium]|nr:hypothetical protein [Acidobacteriota bacterium]
MRGKRGIRGWLLALGLASVCWADPVSVDRLQRALRVMAEGTLTEADIVKALRDEGAAFRLTPELERDLRSAGATDTILQTIRAVAPPPVAPPPRTPPKTPPPKTPEPEPKSAPPSAPALPAGPIALESLVQALRSGADQVDLTLRVETQGVAFPYDAAAHSALTAAGAGPRLLTSSAALSLRSPGFGGDFEALEALVRARVDANDLLAELRRNPLGFPVTVTSLEDLRKAGGSPELEQGLVDIALSSNQDPLSLELLEAALTVRYAPTRLSRAVQAWGVAFAPTAESQGALRAAGASPELLDGIVARWLASSTEPLSLDEVLGLWELGASDAVLIETLGRRGASFPVSDENAALLNKPELNDALRQAILAAALENQGFQRMPARQAEDYDPFAASGRFDLRIHVDKVEEIYIVGDLILRKALDGAPSSNAGSEYSQAIPRQGIVDGSFEVQQMDGRGKIAVMAKPSAENGYLFKARVYDEKGAADRYHLRLTWRTR